MGFLRIVLLLLLAVIVLMSGCGQSTVPPEVIEETGSIVGNVTDMENSSIQTYNSDEGEYLLEKYWSVVSETENYQLTVGDSGYYPEIYMLPEEDAEDYGYSPGSAFIAGQVSIIFAGAEAALNPASGEVGYVDSEGTVDYDLEGIILFCQKSALSIQGAGKRTRHFLVCTAWG